MTREGATGETVRAFGGKTGSLGLNGYGGAQGNSSPSPLSSAVAQGWRAWPGVCPHFWLDSGLCPDCSDQQMASPVSPSSSLTRRMVSPGPGTTPRSSSVSQVFPVAVCPATWPQPGWPSSFPLTPWHPLHLPREVFPPVSEAELHQRVPSAP